MKNTTTLLKYDVKIIKANYGDIQMITLDSFMNFRDDLRNGMTLENALMKHHFTLLEVFNYCHRRNLDSQYRFIYLGNGTFNIRRYVNGKQEYYACCKELGDAMLVRDKLMECDWDKSQVPRIMEELNEDK